MEIGLFGLLLRSRRSLKGNILSEFVVMTMTMMNVGQMLDIFGLDDPPTRFLTRRLLERMVSRDAGIGLMMLLLMMSACPEGSKPLEPSEVSHEDWTQIF